MAMTKTQALMGIVLAMAEANPALVTGEQTTLSLPVIEQPAFAQNPTLMSAQIGMSMFCPKSNNL